MPSRSFLSRQVIRGNYYFLDLRAKPSASRTIVLCGGLEECAPGYRISRPKGFFCHGIEFVVGGKGIYTTAGRTHTLQAGSLYHYSPGEPHLIQTDDEAPLIKYFVDFVGDPAMDMIRSGPLKLSAPMSLPDYRQAVRFFEDMQACGERKTSSSAAICARLLEVLLLHLKDPGMRQPEGVSVARETYTRCRAYIQEHCRSLKTLEDIARQCHADPSYLCRLFQRFGDRSPYRLLILLKMRRAAELMASGDMLVKEVACDIGYDDPYRFSKVFKRVHGVAPKPFLTVIGKKKCQKMPV